MAGKILVVDDTPQNIRLLEAVLVPQGYQVAGAGSGEQGLALLAEGGFDLVLLDILMPGIDGYEVCRRIRSDAATAALPVVMITSSADQDKKRALDAGADDFVPKPFDRAELLARVRSLLRVKEYHDTIQRQAAELAEWNVTLSKRVEDQVAEIQRLARLRRFLSPQLADLIVSGESEVGLESHRRQIAVVFIDLRGFTPFSESAEPEDVMRVLREFHEVVGELIHETEATVGYFAGDGLMVFFNDPIQCPDPAMRAVHMAAELRERMRSVTAGWKQRGHDVDFGVGITLGYATLGEIGFEGRFDYGAIGSVVNLASRLCGESKPGQILVSQPVMAALDEGVEAEELDALTLKGFARPIPAFSVTAVRDSAKTPHPNGLPGGLSAREAEVLRMLAAGDTSREIGERLYLSRRTVERHIANIYLKVDAHGRAEATAWAIANGIATLPQPGR
jgi:adenylate cyclase